MCLMWSTDEPPDIIEDTPPFDDIADAFGITINWEEALELYDMHLDEAVTQLIEMQQRQCHHLPRVSTYQHIATIFTEDNRFDDAISICYQAIELGLEDGTQSGFSGRIARIKKKEG